MYSDELNKAAEEVSNSDPCGGFSWGRISGLHIGLEFQRIENEEAFVAYLYGGPVSYEVSVYLLKWCVRFTYTPKSK